MQSQRVTVTSIRYSSERTTQQTAPLVEHDTRNREHEELLWLATKRLGNLRQHDGLTLDQYREAFYSLVPTVSETFLGRLAGQLADNPFAPRQCVHYLCNEGSSIASPLLRQSPVLTQLDLVRIVEHSGVGHAREISTRSDLGPSLIKRLRRFNDGMINHNLDTNPAVAISRDAKTLFASILNEDTSTSEIKVTAPVKPEISPSDQLLAAAARGNRLPQRPSLAIEPSKPLRPKTVSNEQFWNGMERAALSRTRQAMCTLMTKRFNISLDAAQQVLEDKTGDALAVVLKAANTAAPLANRISLLTFPALGLSVHNTKRAIKYYSGLEAHTCRETIDLWPKAEDGADRPASRHHAGQVAWSEREEQTRSPHHSQWHEANTPLEPWTGEQASPGFAQTG